MTDYYYPINLNLHSKKCVVVGGGKVAERKIIGLLECKAKVTVISPKLTPRLEELLNKKKINYVSRTYRKGDLTRCESPNPAQDKPGLSNKVRLVIASTDNSKVNRQVWEEARKLGILVNVVSAPKLSDFTLPGVLRRGSLMVTVSTSGKSPALSRRLRFELEKVLGEEYETFTELLGAVRKKFRNLSPANRRRIYTAVATSKIPKLLRSKKYNEAEKEFKKITGRSFDEIGFKF
ncbi:MAG TPA: bifunctional precorrin-2 dehydrogenase/sirohydrochlorin ferrochelatase [Thermodesulfobacteriota bacterium]|nr:bifunctional precorrin-2 dehydrogenase/sirohydrochlorin ferrochelatase [Thermodesulfobacteriota bacterium]